MRKYLIIALSSIALVFLAASPVIIQACYVHWRPPPRLIDPFVSTQWLEDNLENPDLIILDVRTPGEGFSVIPGSINVFGVWYSNPPIGPPFPWMEMPPIETLFGIIGEAGITEDSLVVVVGGTSGPLYPIPFGLYGIAEATRVAITLLYAGVRNVAILNGGFDVWSSEGRPVSDTPATPSPVTYMGTVDESMVVSKDYVKERIGRSRRYKRTILVDARDAEVYFGVIDEMWPPTPAPGHIPTAKSFPTPWLWNLNLDDTGSFLLTATYKDADTLKEMAAGVVGKPSTGYGWGWTSREIIVYCGVGGYASTMFFVLREALGYRNVKIYDGSWQEWTSDPAGPITIFEWE